MGKVDAAVGKLADGRVVSDHQDGVSFVVKLAEQANHGLLIRFVEIAGGLVGENQLGMVDQSASDGDALLFAAGELRGQVLDAIGEPDACEGGASFGFVGSAMKILGEHHVFKRGEVRDQMELLEDESDFFCAKTSEALFVETGNVDAVDDVLCRRLGYRGRREY